MKSRFFLSLSEYYHTKYWLVSPGRVPPNSTQNNERVPELVPATCRQWEPIQDNLHLFPKPEPMPKWLWHVHGLLGRPQFSSLLCQTLLTRAQETVLSVCPSASTRRPGRWHRDSGKTPSHLTGDVPSHFTIPYTSTSVAGTQPATEHLLVSALDLQQETKSYKSNTSQEIKDTTDGPDLCHRSIPAQPCITSQRPRLCS